MSPYSSPASRSPAFPRDSRSCAPPGNPAWPNRRPRGSEGVSRLRDIHQRRGTEKRMPDPSRRARAASWIPSGSPSRLASAGSTGPVSPAPPCTSRRQPRRPREGPHGSSRRSYLAWVRGSPTCRLRSASPPRDPCSTPLKFTRRENPRHTLRPRHHPAAVRRRPRCDLRTLARPPGVGTRRTAGVSPVFGAIIHVLAVPGVAFLSDPGLPRSLLIAAAWSLSSRAAPRRGGGDRFAARPRSEFPFAADAFPAISETAGSGHGRAGIKSRPGAKTPREASPPGLRAPARRNSPPGAGRAIPGWRRFPRSRPGLPEP